MSLLLELQEIDIKRDIIKKELATISKKEEQKKIAAEFKNYQLKYEKIKAAYETGRLGLKKIEGDIELLEAKAVEEEKKLYSGKITIPKELSAIQMEIDDLKKRKDRLETEELEQIDKVKELEGRKQKLETYLRALKKKFEELEKLASSDLKQKEAELKELDAARKEFLGKVPSEEGEAYERLRSKMGGRVAARLEDGMCGSCSMRLPSDEVDKMLIDRDRFWVCSNCSRILVTEE